MISELMGELEARRELDEKQVAGATPRGSSCSTARGEIRMSPGHGLAAQGRTVAWASTSSAWTAPCASCPRSAARSRPSTDGQLNLETTEQRHVDAIRPDLVERPLARPARARPGADPRRLDRGPRLHAARREPAARRARPARARRRRLLARLAGQGPHHQGRHRRVDRRAVRDRHPRRRPARPGRRYDGLRQVRAAADADRLAGGRQPARRVQLRARRLQGRRGVQGLQPPAAHGRHGHRPRRPPDHPRAGVAGRGAAPPRAPAGRRRRQGHRGLPRRSRSPDRRADAAAADRHRRVRRAGRRAARLRDRAWSTWPGAVVRSAYT